MDITGKTALVTGASRGLGRHLASELRDRGAYIYAAAATRRPWA
jgi:NAD(P)-dependent dehydrogenase (short-subunit alcohol dehydrogenase family)